MCLVDIALSFFISFLSPDFSLLISFSPSVFSTLPRFKLLRTDEATKRKRRRSSICIRKEKKKKRLVTDLTESYDECKKISHQSKKN